MKTIFSGWRYLWKSEDIRRKLIITFVLLAIYRIAANVPVPGVDREVLAAFRNTGQGSNNFLGFLDLLSGGTVSNFSLLSMGVYPYITAQIIIQLLAGVIPQLERMLREEVDGAEDDVLPGGRVNRVDPGLERDLTRDPQHRGIADADEPGLHAGHGHVCAHDGGS